MIGKSNEMLSFRLTVLDDAGSWWCLRAPSGRTGHVPKTHLEIVPNPLSKESDRYNDQNVDPIVVKVPVIVKASVKHHEVEEQVKSKPPELQPSSQTITNQSAVSRQPSSLTPPPPVEVPQRQYPEPKQEIPFSAPAAAPNEQKAELSSNYPVPPPQSIFPPVKYGDRQGYQTVVKEVIREVPSYRHYRRNKSRYESKRDISPQYSDASGSTSSSSSSGVASWISDGAQRRGSSRNRRSKSQQKTHHSARRSVTQPSKAEPSPPSPHRCCHSGKDCRYRSVCCYSSKGSRARSTITDVSHRESNKRDPHQSLQQNQQQQPQQPMIILLEAPKQETPQPEMIEGQMAEDYYDPNNQPQISIVLPPNAQLGPAMSTYTPMQTVMQTQPQYAQAPTYYNWTPQYYQSYA
ncbi:unnamed protein product [Hymenolepis diminuta]|uniref:SH3 domain-containing protein n=1 Tax=Hymenolepis diminuta TaxID=6216 RepID=A0A0R3SWL1_HYMDI|nr:unnamed protein product [Hymenolepis diminuta]